MINDVKQFLSRLLYPSGSIRTVLRGPLRGKRFVAAPAMRARYALMADSWDESFFVGKINTGDVVFDVGANRGQLTLLFAQEVGSTGKVISFEPMEENVDLLRRNIALNGFENVQVVNAAAASAEGTLAFEYAQASSKEVSEKSGRGDSRNVESVTVDQIAERHDTWPDLLKIDVEGGAKGVFEGAQRTLNRKPYIFLETHNFEERRAAEKQILGRGYTVQILAEQGLIEESAESVPEGRHIWCTPQ